MNCVLFAKMDQVFSLNNKTLKKYWKMEKDTGKVREFCQSRKVGTLIMEHPPPHVDRQTPLKTLPSRNFVCRR